MSHTITPVTYRTWSLSYGHASRQPAYDEAEARRRFEAGDTIWVLFGDETQPDLVLCVELGGRLVEVTWLDHLNRPETKYLFAQPEGHPEDELFLQQVRLKGYDHDLPLPDGVASYNEVWFFRPDGTLHGQRGALDGPSESTDGHLDVDQLALHRERRPAFGEWDSLIVRDR